MIGKKKAKEYIDLALKETTADQLEVIVYNFNQALTRFANNYIHQHVQESNTSIAIRTIFGKKIGSASTNSLSPQKIKETVKWAEAIAKFQNENPDFISLPKTKPNAYKKIKSFVKKTAQLSNSQRVAAVKEIIGVANKNSLVAYGSVSNGTSEIAIGNSLGTYAYNIAADIFCNIVMSGKNSTGYVQSGTRDVSEMDYIALAEAAAKKSLISEDPIEFTPGQYPTIFEPFAVSDLLDYFAHYAFNGRLYEEGRSYLTKKLGTKIVDERMTIIDDPFNRRGFVYSFDFEGVPKRRVVLVENGVAKNVVYDSLTASRAKKKSTGHALIAPNPFGPVPINIVMKGGDETIEEMIKKTKRGLLVTRLHYTNVIDPYKLTITGMTRDGTFLIEDGIITKGVKNLRFTENLIEAFNRISAISKKPELVAAELGYSGRFGRGMIVPAIKINNFTFTSATEF